MNEVYARHVGDRRRRARRSRSRSCRRERSSRSRRSRCALSLRAPELGGHNGRMKAIEDYVARSASTPTSSAAPSATSCSGASRRTPTSSSPGVDTEGLRAALAPHGRVEDLVVAGRPVGAPALPARAGDARARAGRDRVRAAAPRALDRARPARLRDRRRPRREVEDDLARRDFTVNAIARRLADRDARRPVPRPSRPRARRAPHRLAAQLRRGPAAARPRAAPRLAARPRARRGDAARDARGGGARCGSSPASGSAAASRPTAWASSRSSCSGAARARRSRSRATRACSSRCCPSSSRRSASTRTAGTTDLTVDEHIFAVVQAAADAGMPLRVRLAALFHDLGKPHVAWRGHDGRLHFYARPGNRDHAEAGASADAPRACATRRARERVVRIVRFHMFTSAARHADARGCCSLRRGPDARPARPQGGRPARQGREPGARARAPARFRGSSSESASPHRSPTSRSTAPT